MKTIIAGSRTMTNPDIVEKAIAESGFAITEVVSGCALGVDLLGFAWAKTQGTAIKMFPADWNTHGKAAGPIRNSQMAEYAEALIAIWDGKSMGTRDMIQKAKSKGLKVFIFQYA